MDPESTLTRHLAHVENTGGWATRTVSSRAPSAPETGGPKANANP